MTTKDKIIQTAIRLYNEHGLANVTSRHIAAEIGISHGNLDYHFPSREDLLRAIYECMRAEISEFYGGANVDQLDPIEHLQLLLIRLEDFQWKYKFFTLDVREISRKYPNVGQLLKETLELRRVQLDRLIGKFVERAYMKPEPVEGFYKRLHHNIRILITFWNLQEELLGNVDQQRKGEMTRHIWELLLPHFTEKGLRAYRSIWERFPDHTLETAWVTYNS